MAEIAPTLPHNPDAERSVLGAILVDEKTYLPAVLALGITSRDFFLPQNRTVYHEILSMHDKGKAVDLLTLNDWLGEHGKLEAAGGAGYIASLSDGIPRITNVGEYVRIVKEKSRRRRLIHLGERLQHKAFRDEDLEALEKEITLGVRSDSAALNGNGNGHFTYPLIDFLSTEFPAPEHLIEGVIPRAGSVMIVAQPHRGKSWLTTALALASTRAGQILGHLEVAKPVRTLLVQVEDFPGQVQWRIRQLIATRNYGNIEPSNMMVIPRQAGPINDAWYERLEREAQGFKPDHIIIDVLRRVFHRGDMNSPKDSALYLEDVDSLRDNLGGCTVTLVHHENKKDAEIMTAAAGSYNFAGWANVMIQLKRKTTEGAITHVEIEVDNKVGVAPEPMRMTINLNADEPVRLMSLDDKTGLDEALDRLGSEWDVRALAEVLEIHKTNAYRRLKKWIAEGMVEKIVGGKRGGNNRSLARYRAITPTD